MATLTAEPPSVAIQPTPVQQDQRLEGELAVAGQQAAGAAEQKATYDALTQQSLSILKDLSLKQAQEEGRASVKYDDKGNLLPQDKGFAVGGIGYMMGYNEAADAYYAQAAGQEHQQQAQKILLQNPTEPTVVNEQIKKLNEEKLSLMTPSMRARMTPVFESNRAAAVNQADAGRLREISTVNDAQAQNSMNAYSSLYARLYQDSQANPGNKASNDAQLAQYWAETSTLLQKANHTPEFIAEQKNIFEAIGKAKVTAQYYQQKAAGLIGKPTELALLQADLDSYYRGDPEMAKYEKYTKPIIDRAISVGGSVANAAYQADAMKQASDVGGLTLKSNQMQWLFQNGYIDLEDFRYRQMQMAETVGQMMAGKRPEQQAQLLVAARAGEANITAAYGAALSTGINQANYGETDQQKQQGLQTLRALTTDSFVQQQAASSPQYASLLSQANVTLAKNHAEGLVGDKTAWLSSLVSGDGKVKPEQWATAVEEGRARGFVGGPFGYDAAAMTQARALYDKNYAENQSKIAAGQTIASQQMPLDANGNLRTDVAPVVHMSNQSTLEAAPGHDWSAVSKSPDGRDRKVPFNVGVNEHVDQAGVRMETHNSFPSAVPSAISSLPRRGFLGEATEKNLIRLRTIAEQHAERLFTKENVGNRDVLDVRNAFVIDQLGGVENWQFVNGKDRDGNGKPVVSPAQAVQGAPVGRNAPGPEAAPDRVAEKTTSGTVPGLFKQAEEAGTLGGQLGAWWTETIYGPGGWMDQTFKTGDPTNPYFAANPRFKDKNNVDLFKGSTLNQLLGGMIDSMNRRRAPGQPLLTMDGTNLRMDPATQTDWETYAKSYIEKNGEALRTANLDPMKQAFISWLGEESMRDKNGNSRLSLVRVDDPVSGQTYAQLSKDEFFAKVNSNSGTNFGDEAGQDLAYARLAKRDPGFAAKTQPGRLFVRSELQPGGGKAQYIAYGYSNMDNKPVAFGPVDPDDGDRINPRTGTWQPGFSDDRNRLAAQAAAELQDYGVGRFLRAMGLGGGAIAKWVQDNKVEGIAGVEAGRTQRSQFGTDLSMMMRSAILYGGIAINPDLWGKSLDQIVADNPHVPGLDQATADKMKRDDVRNTIARYGALHYWLFGSEPTPMTTPPGSGPRLNARTVEPLAAQDPLQPKPFVPAWNPMTGAPQPGVASLMMVPPAPPGSEPHVPAFMRRTEATRKLDDAQRIADEQAANTRARRQPQVPAAGAPGTNY